MEAHAVHLSPGETLLEAALRQDIEVAHDCGGALACVSCQVTVREGADRLSEASEDEIDLLDRAGIADPDARLACQATGSGGVVIELPEATAPALAGDPLPVTMTAEAAAFLALHLAKHPGAVAVRLGVRPAGCSGLRYVVEPAERIGADDRVFDSHGTRIVVAAASVPHLHGTTLDLVRDGLARRLDFANPNATQTCGCGESFGTA